MVSLELVLAFGEFAEGGKDVEIAVDSAFDVGMLHFDDDGPAVEQLGAVDLPDGCRSHRLAIEFKKALGDWQGQFLLDGSDGDVGRIGGRAALQARQLASHIRPDQIGPGAEELPELDEGGAQVRDGHSQTDRKRLIGENLARMAGEHPADRLPLSALEPFCQAVLDEHRRHFGGAGDIAGNLGGQLDFHCVVR